MEGKGGYMVYVDLNGLWKMNKCGDDTSYPAMVPTTMYQVLFENGVIEDPFYGENDNLYTSLSDDEYSFSRSFDVASELLESDIIEMVFKGLDTLATVYLNDTIIAKTDNMHRTYRINVKEELKIGENRIRVEFSSPTQFIKEEQSKDPLWGVDNPMDGYEHLRKAHHMFGWDWGPRLPDMGIWRDVSLEAFNVGRIEEFYVTQKHIDTCVDVDIDVRCQLVGTEEVMLKVTLEDHQGSLVSSYEATARENQQPCFNISEPDLWWPNGYGSQPLYTLKIALQNDEKVLDVWERRIGLRTMTMTREPDQWGESFDMTINGKRIFAMGGDYIPEDALICRMTKDRTQQLMIVLKPILIILEFGEVPFIPVTIFLTYVMNTEY